MKNQLRIGFFFLLTLLLVSFPQIQSLGQGQGESSYELKIENLKKSDRSSLVQKGAKLKIKTKAGESGKIFGAITALQVSDALSAKGYEIDRKKISFEENIKNIGEYKVSLDLHKEVKHEVSINVIAE